MLCFRDRLYCITPGCQCERALTDEVKEAARRWWGKDDPPIAVANPVKKAGKGVVTEDGEKK